MAKTDGEFSGVNVLLTGATSGIGLSTAKQLLELGATVACVGRNHATVEPLIAKFSSKRCIPLVADLVEPGAGGRLAAEALDHLGCVDVLINGAGIGHRADVVEHDRRAVAQHLRAQCDCAV